MGSKPAVAKSNPSHKIQIILDQNRETVRRKETDHRVNNFLPQTNNQTIKENFIEIVQELDRLVGLDDIKNLIFEIYAWMQVGQYREALGLKTDTSQALHMIFKGNPGTGKTTVARIMAKMFKNMGILSKGHLIEVERADLVGEYIGYTAQKTREQIKKALGGILFIDEAYSLLRGGEKDFGRESIDALVKAMEDYKDDFILILAGYSLEMEAFILANPGLHSRFPIQLSFDDYSLEQLIEIADVMVKERDYILSPGAKHKLKQIIIEEKANPLRNFSNARLVRNWIEKGIRNQAVRLLREQQIPQTKHMLMTIQAEDLLEMKRKYV